MTLCLSILFEVQYSFFSSFFFPTAEASDDGVEGLVQRYLKEIEELRY